MRSTYTGDFDFNKYLEKVVDAETILYTGRVVAVKGLEVESEGPRSVIGEMCTIKLRDGKLLQAEVVGLDDKTVKLAPFSASKFFSPIEYVFLTLLKLISSFAI